MGDSNLPCNRCYETAAFERSDNKIDDTRGGKLHSKSRTTSAVQSHVRTYKYISTCISTCMHTAALQRPGKTVQHGGSEQAKVRQHQKTKDEHGIQVSMESKQKRYIPTDRRERNKQIMATVTSALHGDVLYHLHKVGREYALPAIDLPRPPRICVLALLRDSNHLSFVERQVPSLQPHEERRTNAGQLQIHRNPA